MKILLGYSYFLAVRPGPHWYPSFQRMAKVLGRPLRLDRLHLTLCMIGEGEERDRFVASRVRRALDGEPLPSFPVNLSRLVSGPRGARARTSGRQDELQDFYRALLRLLHVCGIEPLHRKAGLHPHVTLSYERCPVLRLPIALPWYPAELLLIESEVGLTRHNPLARWALLPPRQPLLPYDDVFRDGHVIAAADPAR